MIKRLSSLGLVVVAMATVLAAATVVAVPRAVTIVTANHGTVAALQLTDLAERSSVYAVDGSLLTYLSAGQNRQPVPLDAIPTPVIDAVLTIEDASFYQHDGVNPKATLRALVANVNAGGVTQGGSTITQQLVKNSLVGSQRDLNRKSTEAIYALRLEGQMTKDQILERYLNTVYFGSGAYGVQAAAETYWGYDSPSQLGWPEAALLAGLIRSPNAYDPTLFPEQARARRTEVLDRLVVTGHITRAEADQYEQAPLPAERQQPFSQAPNDYFVQQALSVVLNDPNILGGTAEQRRAALYQGGMKIYTTFDPRAQAAAVQTRNDLLPNSRQNCFTSQRVNGNPDAPCVPDFTVAMATLDSRTGAVRALVGGPDFQRQKFDLATQGRRQPGSTMKPMVLASLFEQGYTPDDIVRTDGPCTLANPGGTPDPYTVNVLEASGSGPSTLAVATRESNNCAFVRLGEVAGESNVLNITTRLGIDTSSMHPVLSLPLGTQDVVPLQMAGAYAAFANDGVYNPPWYIDKIEDRSGSVVYQHQAAGRQAVSSQTAREITQVLEGNVEVLDGIGTGGRARVEGQYVAGKTGTTESFQDAWFVGYSSYYTTAVWLGDPTAQIRIQFPEWAKRGWSSTGRGGFGGELPATIWSAYMTTLHQGRPPVPFTPPDPYTGGRVLTAPNEVG